MGTSSCFQDVCKGTYCSIIAAEAVPATTISPDQAGAASAAIAIIEPPEYSFVLAHFPLDYQENCTGRNSGGKSPYFFNVDSRSGVWDVFLVC
jgi:hypothetical protein